MIKKGIYGCLALSLLVTIAFNSTSASSQENRGRGKRRQANQNDTSASSQENRGRDRRRRGKQNAENGNGQVQKYKIRQVLKSATVNAKVAETFRNNAELQGLVTVNGNTLTARRGYVLARLEMGALVVTNEGNTATGYMQVVTWHNALAHQTIVWCCRCPGSQKDTDDACKFETSNGRDPGKCSGSPCCQKTAGVIDDDTGDWTPPFKVPGM